MRIAVLVAVTALCVGFATFSPAVADTLRDGTYEAEHRFAIFQVRVSGSRISARGRGTDGSRFSSWKTLEVEDRGRNLRLSTPGYIAKVSKRSIKDTEFRSVVTSGGRSYGRLTFTKQ